MKQNKKFIAVTGGIGSGKSTVLQMIGEEGFPVFSADAVARGIYEDKDVLEQTRKAFPDCVCGGVVDRKKLAEQVFSDSEKLEKLNSITHPAVMRILRRQMEEADGAAVFAEVPLLFEGNYQNGFDGVIVVLRDEAVRIRAAAERDGVSPEEIAARIKHQFDYEKNPIIGHTLLYNNGDLSDLREQVRRSLEKIVVKEES